MMSYAAVTYIQDEWWVWPLVVGVVALLVFFGYQGYKERQAMSQGGYLLKRSGAFWRQTQVYTTEAHDFNELFEQVKRFFPPGVEGRRSSHEVEEEYMMFKGHNWQALLDHVGQEAGKEVYEFEFTEFQTSNGEVQHSQEMDMLMTAVEKAFLIEDPFTRYIAKKNTGLKSRASLF